jgi:hypothetical protein
MTGRINVTEALGTIIHDVADGRIQLSEVLETIKTWENDMDARTMVSTHSASKVTRVDAMALRARGMHLAVLSLGVRLELLLHGATLHDPVRSPSAKR